MTFSVEVASRQSGLTGGVSTVFTCLSLTTVLSALVEKTSYLKLYFVNERVCDDSIHDDYCLSLP